MADRDIVGLAGAVTQPAGGDKRGLSEGSGFGLGAATDGVGGERRFHALYDTALINLHYIRISMVRLRTNKSPVVVCQRGLTWAQFASYFFLW